MNIDTCIYLALKQIIFLKKWENRLIEAQTGYNQDITEFHTEFIIDFF